MIAKDGAGKLVVKPRRVATPSDNGTGTRRGLLSSEKPVPNYLRPTISSRGEKTKELKKNPLSSPDNGKTVLARRSSFDRPSATSHLQKIISSGPGERSVTVRSSSFSGRSGIMQRPVSERASTGPLRTVKAVSRTYLTSNVGGKAIAKKNSSTASVSSSLAGKNKEKSSDAAPVVVDDVSGNDNSRGSSVVNSEKLPLPTKEVTKEVLKPAEAEDMVVDHEDLEVVHEEHHDVAHLENDIVDKEEICVDNGIILASKEEDDKNSTALVQPLMEEVREEIKDKEEIVSDDSKGEEKEAEVPKGVAEAAEAETETEDKKENKPMVEEVVVTNEEKEAGDESEKTEDSAFIISAIEKPSEEKEGEAANVEEEKQAAGVEVEKTVVKQRNEKSVAAAAPVKKDPAQANNDIIEETTKKLMESSRKNKVKALAGAFETVISLEKPGQA